MNELSLFSESMNGAQSTTISIMLRFLVMRLTRLTSLTSSMTTAPVSLPCMWVLTPSTTTAIYRECGSLSPGATTTRSL